MMRVILLVGSLVLASCAASSQDIQPLFNYQGKLTDKTGKPVDGTRTMTFALYGSATGGTPLGAWLETQTVAVTKGTFSVILGSTTGGISDPGESPEYYLGITVNGEPLLPRQQLLAVPFAMSADNAKWADEADRANNANNADWANNANWASNASWADNANRANSAGWADNATNAAEATHATSANSAGWATNSINSDFSSQAANSDMLDGMHIENLDDRFVNVSGDAMTGDLNVNGNITAQGDLATWWDATVARMLYVCPGGIGAIKVGDLENSLYNGDIGAANSLRADNSLFLGSSKTEAGIYVRNIAGQTAFAFNSDDTSLAVGAANAPGSIYLRNAANVNTIAMYGASGTINATGKITADAGVEGTGVSGWRNPMPPYTTAPAVPGVKGIGTAGGLLSPAAAGVMAVGGGGTGFGSADLALLAQGYVDILTHDSKGVCLQPGDGAAANALAISGYSAGTTLPLVKIDAGLEVYRSASGGVNAAAIKAENTSGGGIAFTGVASSTDAAMVVVNKGTGDLFRGFSDPNGGALVTQIENNGFIRTTAVYTGAYGTSPPTVNAAGYSFPTDAGDITASSDLMASNNLVVGGSAYIQGNMYVTGTKNAVVPTQDYGIRKVYADESAEVYLFDRGTATLANGRASITLDPIFLQTVTVDDTHPLLVFATPAGDCKGVYVAETTNSSFAVKELCNGASNASFTWEVAAKRKGYENVRLAQPEAPKAQ